MPVTARVSRSCYGRFGDDVVDELVEWFTSVDTTYRNDLRELSDCNFVRFEAGLDRRAAAIDAVIERRFAAIDARFAQVDVRQAQFEARMMRWMLTFWVGTLGGLAAPVWVLVRVR